MKTLNLAAFALACTVLAGCEPQVKDPHPDQLVTKRQALFKQLNRAMEPIGLVANGRKDYKQDEFLVLAQDLEKMSSKPWVYFTPDSNYKPTRAVVAVWDQPDAFKQAQDQYMGTVQQLVQAAQGGNIQDVQKAANQVASSCKSCHRQFRAD